MKYTLLIFSVVASILSAKADVLYWMVGDDYGETATEAKLYAVYSGTDTSISKTPTVFDTKVQPDIYNAWDAYGQFETFLGASAGDGWSYYIEVVMNDKTYVNTPLTYADAQTAKYIYSNPLTDPVSLSNGPFGGGNTTYNVPEPTSGLLFLVGGMLLGLRRKRRV